MGAAAVRPLSGAINARMIVDPGSGYEEVGALEFAPGAQLVSGIGKMDTTFAIENGTDLDQVTLGTWLQCDSEIMAVTALSDTSITVKRGCLDTVPNTHAAGAALIFWDAYAQGDETQYVSGETLKVKLLTVTGAGELPVNLAAEDTITMSGRAIRPYPPGAVRINSAWFPEYIEGPLSMVWAHRDRKQQTGQNLIGFTEGSIGPEAGTTYTLELRGESGSLQRTYSGLTGTSQSWTTEAEDGGFYTPGAFVSHVEAFVTGVPGSYGTQRYELSSGTNGWDASVQALVLISPTANQTYYELTSLPFFNNFDFELDLEVQEDYSSDSLRHFGMWLADSAGTPKGYRLAYWGSSPNRWGLSRWNAAGRWSSETNLVTANYLAVQLNQRVRLRVIWDGATGLIQFYVDGVKIIETTDTACRRLRPGIFFYHNKVRVHEVRLLGNEAVERLNNQVTAKLYSVVSSRASWQPYQHTVTRVGYGYSYGVYYGGI